MIWKSFGALPLWVKIWMVLVLGPVNMASIFFLDEPQGVLIAILAYGGMILNLPIIWVEKGMSKMMSLPHVLVWTPLMFVLWPLLGAPYATILFVVNLISLVFDYVDSWKWLKGDRAVAGHTPQ